MQIDYNTIDRVAHLARLRFDEAERTKLVGEMNKILSFCEKLNELNTDGVEPLIYLTDEVNTLREDVAKTEITKEEALKNAPKKNTDYFKVPKFLDKE